MKKRVGILTSGGDCPGLNATIRGAAKALYQRFGDEVEIVGIQNGYDGLIKGEWREMQQYEFSGILTVGGTILGTKRTPFKMMTRRGDDKVDKVAAMKKNVYRMRSWTACCAWAATARIRRPTCCSEEGLNIIGLPKTIDNDIYGTDVTFGFHTRRGYRHRSHRPHPHHRRHVTAAVMVVEIMGHKVGWLTLHAGIAGGADIILIPELPYDIDKIMRGHPAALQGGQGVSPSSAVAEGAISHGGRRPVEEGLRTAKQRDYGLPLRLLRDRTARRSPGSDRHRDPHAPCPATCSAAAALRHTTVFWPPSSAPMRQSWWRPTTTAWPSP